MKRRLNRCTILVVVCLGFGVACVPVRTSHPPAPPRVSLELVNRSSNLVRAHLGVEYLGEVEPGRRWRYGSLQPGTIELRYRFLPSTREHRRRITLTHRTTVVELTEPGIRPLPIPPRLAAIEIRNTAAFSMRAYLNGVLLGVVLPRDTRRFEHLAALTSVVEGRDFQNVVHFRKRLSLSAQSLNHLRFRAQVGTLLVINRGGEALEVFVDDERLGQVPAGRTTRFGGVRIGVRPIKIVGTFTKNVTVRRIRVLNGHTVRWEVWPLKSTVWLKNLSTESVVFSVDRGQAMVVPPRSQRLAPPLAPGPHRLDARGLMTGRRLVREITLNREEVYVWRVLPQAGQVRVTNLTPESATLYIDGALQCTLKPKQMRVFDNIVASEITIQARLQLTRVTLQRRFALRGKRLVHWRIQRTTANLLIENRLAERVLVSVRGQNFGYLAPGSQSWVQFAPGRTRVRLIEDAGGDHHLKDFLARNGGVYRWRVEPKSKGIRIRNDSGEPLEISVDGLEYGSVDFQASLTLLHLTRGSHRLHATGKFSAHRYSTERWLTDKQRVLWRVEPVFGFLKVRNLLRDAVDVRVRGRLVGQVGPGDARVFKLGVGHVPIEARRISTGEVRTSSLIVRPVTTPVWELREVSPRLNVRNETQEPVEVRLDGRYLGRVEIGRSLAFDNLRIKRVSLTAYGLHSHTRYETVKLLRRASRVIWKLSPAKGLVEIRNPLKETVRVRFRFDNKEYRVGPNTSRIIEVPVGFRIVLIRGADTRRYRKERFLVAEGHRHRVSLDAWMAELVVFNRDARPLRIFVRERPVGWVQPGRRRVFKMLTPGWTTAKAMSADGKYRVIRRIALQAGRGSWIIPPAISLPRGR